MQRSRCSTTTTEAVVVVIKKWGLNPLRFTTRPPSGCGPLSHSQHHRHRATGGRRGTHSRDTARVVETRTRICAISVVTVSSAGPGARPAPALERNCCNGPRSQVDLAHKRSARDHTRTRGRLLALAHCVHTQHHSDYIYITHPHTLQYGYAHGLAAIAPLLASSKAVPLPRPRLYRSSPPPHGALEVLAGRGVAPAVGLEQKRGTRAAAVRR